MSIQKEIYQVRYTIKPTKFNTYKLEVNGCIMRHYYESVVDSLCALSIGGFDGLCNGRYTFEFRNNIPKKDVIQLLDSIKAIKGFKY